MKKSLLFLVLFAIHFTAGAQFYIESSASYGIPLFKQYIKTEYSFGASGYYIRKNINGSFGGGAGYNVGVGYIFREHFLAGLEFNHSNGTRVESELVDSTSGTVDMIKTNEYTTRINNISSRVGFVFVKERFSFSAISGMVIGFRMKMNSVYTEDAPNGWGGYSFIREDKFSGNVSLGFTQAFNVHYELVKNLSLGLGVSGTFQNWTPKYGEQIRNEFNGRDQLQDYSYSVTHYEFVDEVIQPGSGSSEERGQQLKQTFSYSSLNFNLSLKYVFKRA